MSVDKIDPDEQVIRQLAEVVDTLGKVLEDIVDRHDGLLRDRNYLREDLKDVRNSIRHISKVLHEGNGDRPLISRVAVLEEQIKTMRANSLNEKAKELITKKGVYALYAAVITGIFGTVTSIISLLSN